MCAPKVTVPHVDKEESLGAEKQMWIATDGPLSTPNLALNMNQT